VVEHAQQNGASPDTEQVLQQLPAQNFSSVGELVSKLPMSGLEQEIGKLL
jgi:hypothetical protein